MSENIGTEVNDEVVDQEICDMCNYIAELEEENETLMEENSNFYNREKSLRLALQIVTDCETDKEEKLVVLNVANDFYNYLTEQN